MKKIVLGLATFVLTAGTAVTSTAKEYSVSSPGGDLTVKVESEPTLSYSVTHKNTPVITDSRIALRLGNGTTLGEGSKTPKLRKSSIRETVPAYNYKRQQVENNYNEIELTFREGYSVIFRAYDDGAAYRIKTDMKSGYTVTDEIAEFSLPEGSTGYIPYVRARKDGSFEQQFFNSFENIYTVTDLKEWEKERLSLLPLAAKLSDGKTVCITEADLFDYPGMYLLNKEGGNKLSGVFAPYPDRIVQGGHNELQGIVETRKDYIAELPGKAQLPWRIIIVAENDTELADSDMIYKIAENNRLDDISWIKPGKVAWDWWNGWNLYGVDFRAGINNDTYKYYIDFASENGIEYVILDEGWAVNKKADLMLVIPEIDLPQLAAYADSRNVGLILWAGYLAFDRDMEAICKHYSEMGIKGFKIDFMDRDDQPMVNFHTRAAEVSAKYKLLVDFHGTYKPTGLHKTYPNVINFEGVFGLEQMKWADVSVDQVTYDVTMPYIRMVAGPIDYTQGAMRNAIKRNYRPVYTEAMSQGTRCRQLAQYVIFESPLNMMCDSPSNYMNEQESTDFISAIPTIWDETRVLNGVIGEYLTIARQKDGVWYVGSMTNWDERTLTLDLSFIGEGNFAAEIFADGINADRAARDYTKKIIEVPADRKLDIKMAPGGGVAIKIYSL